MNSNSNQIILKGLENPFIEITASALAESSKVLAWAREVTIVQGAEQQALAVDALGQLKSLSKRMEQSRELAKRPALEIGRLLDAKAKEFCLPLNEEAERVSRLISAFQRIEAARVCKIREEEEAKRRKTMAEEAAKLAALDAKMAKAKSSAKLSSLAAEKQIVEQETQQKVLESVALENSQQVIRKAGMIVRKEWNFEVLDIHALFRARPECIKFEPNSTVIRGLIGAGNREIPGLRIWEETSTTVRT